MGLRQPVFGEVKKGGFVMGPASKQTTPSLDYTAGRVSPRALFAARSGDVPDMPSIELSGQRVVSASPKTSYSIRPETFGPQTTERVVIGSKPRSMSVKEGLNIRRGQDALLKTTKAGGGYTAETNSPEIMGRQEFAGGLRKDIGRVSPEIKANNKRISRLIDLSKASGKRADVSSRNNLMDLTDSMMTTASVLNPKALALLAARKVWQGGKAGIARSLYNAPSFGKDAGLVLTSPAVRALLGLENDQ